MRASLLGLGLSVVILVSLVPAVPAASWVFGHTWGGAGEDVAVAVDTDDSGNVYLVGSTPDSSSGGSAVFVAKFDPLGRLVWNRVFSLNDPAFGQVLAYDAAVSPTGETYVLGAVQDLSYSWSLLILKVSANGNLGFARSATAVQYANRIALNVDSGGVVVAADATGYGDGRVLSVSASGVLRWAEASATPEAVSPWGLATDSGGNTYTVVDRVDTLGIAKFNRQGQIVGQRVLNGATSTSWSWDLALGPDGFLYGLGYAYGSGSSLLVKFDTQLNPIWTELIGGPGESEETTRILALADGTLAAAGSSSTTGSYLIRTDADGQLLESSKFPAGTAGAMYADAVALPGGGFALAGAIVGPPTEEPLPISDTAVLPPGGGWDSDIVVWNAASDISLANVAFTSADPEVPVDAVGGILGTQAWFAAFDVPPSGLDVHVGATASDADPLTVQFAATVANGTTPYAYQWSFGDGGFSQAQNPSHTYSQLGTFLVQLTVADAAARIGRASIKLDVLRSASVHSDVDFNHVWGNVDDEDVTALVADTQGNVYVVGAVQNATTRNYPTYVAKFDRLGALEWNHILQVPGSNVSYQNDACLDSAGNFVVSVDPYDDTAGDQGMIAKFSPTGDLIYAKIVDEVRHPYRIAADPATGGVVIAGDSDAYGSGRVVTLEADGSVRWATAIGTDAFASPWGLAVDSEGTSYVFMDRSDDNVGMAKFDVNGNLMSQRILLSPIVDYSYDLAMGNDGYLYALGNAFNDGYALVAKLDRNLLPIWSEYMGSPQWMEFPFRIVPLADGDLALWGYNENSSGWSMAEYRVSPAGALRQETRYPVGPSQDALFWDATSFPGGGLLAAGSTSQFVPGTGEAVLDAGAWPVGAPWAVDNMAWASTAEIQTRDKPVTLQTHDASTDDFRSANQWQAWYAGIDVPVSPPDVTFAATPGASSWTYDFTSSVRNGTSPYAYRWSFGDGAFADTAGASHVFSGGSHFLVQLFVEDASGAVGMASQRLQIGSPPVISSLTASPEVPSVGQTVSFVADASDPDGGGIVRYDWNLGDGTQVTTTAGTVNHAYAYPYTYQVMVTVTDDEGDTASYSRSLTVTAPAFLWAYAQTAQTGLVPSTIRVDGVPMDDWRVQGVELPSGPHLISFSDVPDKGTPAPFQINMGPGSTHVTGLFETYGYLRVSTEPALPATITVNGVPLDDWGFWMSVPPGTYSVSFGAVDGYDPPASQVVTVSVGANTWVAGSYAANANAVGPDPSTYGRLRVTTAIDDGRAGVASTISVDGVPRDQWALSYLKLPPGSHTVTFSDVPGLGTPAPMEVGIVAGETTSVVGTFRLEGWLRVVTNPPAGGLISVDGAVRDAWGMWQAMPPGDHTVSFGPVIAGFCPGACVIPGPQTVTLTPGNLTTVMGDYSGQSAVVSTATLPNGPARMSAQLVHPAAGVRLRAPSAKAVRDSALASEGPTAYLPTRARPSGVARLLHLVLHEASAVDVRTGLPLTIPATAVLGLALAAPVHPYPGGLWPALRSWERRGRARPSPRTPPSPG